MRHIAFCVAVAGATLAAASVQAADTNPIASVKYTCADNQSIDATYYPGKVEITLSDGRSMSLPQTVSGSGARYANGDESIVFWNKGNDAFVTEGDPDQTTYADCVGQK